MEPDRDLAQSVPIVMRRSYTADLQPCYCQDFKCAHGRWMLLASGAEKQIIISWLQKLQKKQIQMKVR